MFNYGILSIYMHNANIVQWKHMLGLLLVCMLSTRRFLISR